MSSQAKKTDLPPEDEFEKLRRELKSYKEREEKAINDRTNLQYLLYTTRDMTEIESLNEMIQLVLERLYNTYRPWGFALLIENADRPTVIEYMGFLGLGNDSKRLVLSHHEIITNDIAKTGGMNDDDIDLFFDDDKDDDFMFTVGPAETEDDKKPKVDVDEDTDNHNYVYGSDKEAVSKILAPDGDAEWMVMPGNIGEEHELKVFIRGVTIDSETLATIRLFLSLVSALIHNHLLQNKLEKLANTDALTGLVNRGGLDASMEQYKHMARETDEFVFAIIAIDVNGLKYVNDTFGHEAGDKLINTVGDILRRSCRKTDVISRSGGDEFIILCPNTNFEKTIAIVDRIRKYEQETKLTFTHKETGATESVSVRMSLGVADSDEFEPSKVLAEADHRESLDKQEYYKTHKKYR
ncbi:GGDEF domain-containing protein [Pseudobacteriovorax antillogorgiicola]|uniref:diguanylate cyclase n=1 Tax=Pseudobacteriovorax antillogorgiicola TaxID=1513793 RepID=A0A1Y6CSX5_9BACT|nr:GGDEF domain-containing protein [Pseudobacteriovorax antillogorgiicola]TCS45438.1 diguanylate cyclase (GGDEF)-like protein [Pseudobacteriovorax antillogorgiicola]SMF74511.1 diguanylate cyclase (GGDEF) domain-containing protein [Pseudobacteriovorax antillogorgiicola]